MFLFRGFVANNRPQQAIDRPDKLIYMSFFNACALLGNKEALQIIILLLVLFTAAGLLYHFRDPLSTRFNKATSSITAGPQPELERSSPKTDDGTRLLESSAPAAVPLISEPETSKIYLETGRVIDGLIKSEDDEWVRVEANLEEGKGMLLVKKSQILRIETGSKTRKLK